MWGGDRWPGPHSGWRPCRRQALWEQTGCRASLALSLGDSGGWECASEFCSTWVKVWWGPRTSTEASDMRPTQASVVLCREVGTDLWAGNVQVAERAGEQSNLKLAPRAESKGRKSLWPAVMHSVGS